MGWPISFFGCDVFGSDVFFVRVFVFIFLFGGWPGAE
jgi:hypothetical protein